MKILRRKPFPKGNIIILQFHNQKEREKIVIFNLENVKYTRYIELTFINMLKILKNL